MFFLKKAITNQLQGPFKKSNYQTMRANNQESKFLDRLIITFFLSLFGIPPFVWYTMEKTLFETGLYLSNCMINIGAVIGFWYLWITPPKTFGDVLSLILIFGFLNITMWLELSVLGLFVGHTTFDHLLGMLDSPLYNIEWTA